MTALLGALLLAAAIQFASGCASVKVQVGENALLFRQLTLEEQRSGSRTLQDSGRAIYVELNPESRLPIIPLFLFHHSSSDGLGRWKISKELSTDADVTEDGAIAYLSSWAVTPFNTLSANGEDKNNWMLGAGFGGGDVKVQVTCQSDGTDTSLYLDTPSLLRPELSGIYVQRFMSSDKPLWARVKEHSRDRQWYLFPIAHPVGCEGSACARMMWMLGEEYGVDSGLGNAPGIFGASFPPADAAWEVVSPFPQDNNKWISDPTSVMYSCSTVYNEGGMALAGDADRANSYQFSDVLELVRFVHSIKSLPQGQGFLRMSNRVPVPQMGLGTGGIFLEQAMEVFSNALSLGYRMFDLAREYGNEHVIKELLNNGLAKRGEIFLATKVWPTELGFEPTSKAITTSLREMGTTYIDLYMLHWPRCDPSIEWMHCQDTVEVHGTWRESWRALEKAYAEGRVMGIGVSNFDRALLEELRAQSVVLPHAVQNHAEPGSVDKDVRSWCEAFGILYQPYAPLRNLQFLPEHVKRALKAVAKKHAVSIHQAALRLFIQSGAQVIPRSSSVDHQLENLGAFSWALEEAELRALGWETSVELEVKA